MDPTYVQEKQETIDDLDSKASEGVLTITQLGKYVEARNVVVGSTSTKPYPTRAQNDRNSHCVASSARTAEGDPGKAWKFRSMVESVLGNLKAEEEEVSLFIEVSALMFRVNRLLPLVPTADP